jgi:hypothetical protein
VRFLIYSPFRIATGNQGSLVLPKSNSLECGLAMPLKTTTVETVVGKGVFKLTCEKEQLILYSTDDASRSEEWVDLIGKTIDKHIRYGFVLLDAFMYSIRSLCTI